MTTMATAMVRWGAAGQATTMKTMAMATGDDDNNDGATTTTMTTMATARQATGYDDDGEYNGG